MPSESAISVPVSAHRSSSWCQSAEERASREVSSARISPTCPSPTSATNSLNPKRPSVDAPERPRSSSTTDTDTGGQPSSIARCLSAYCRARDSWFRSSCVGVDWRTYTTARRRRCCSVILPRSLIARRLHDPSQQAREPDRHLHLALQRQRLPHRRRHHHLLLDHQRELSRHEHLRFCRRLHADPDAATAPPDRAPATTATPPATPAHQPSPSAPPARADPSTAPGSHPSCRPAAGTTTPSPGEVIGRPAQHY